MRKSIRNIREESWQRLVFYGEAFGFLVAWVVGVVMLVQAANSNEELSTAPAMDSFAEVSLSDTQADPLK